MSLEVNLIATWCCAEHVQLVLGPLLATKSLDVPVVKR